MNWLNAAILFGLFAGHCELMAAWVNRVHALPWHRTVLKSIRTIHDVLIVGFLPAVVWQVGLNGPQLLNDGRWELLPTPWRFYFALCVVGFFLLVAGSIRWLRRHNPETRSTRLVDVSRELEKVPSGSGLRGRIARLPFNEVFLLEINEKHYTFHNLPQELDGLSIAHVSDVHLRGPVGRDYFRYAFDRISEMNADLVAFTGDLIDNPDLLEWLPDTFGQLSAPLGRWFILGNHDWMIDAVPVRKAMTDLGWHDISSQVKFVEHCGRRIAIAGDETPWMGTPPAIEAARSADLRILLSHTPDNFRRACRQRVDLMLSGHNHGGQVCLPIIGPVYSPSRYGIAFAAGSYTRGSTTLHVSRGLSAERPLRWNCPPEITRIVLRFGTES